MHACPCVLPWISVEDASAASHTSDTQRKGGGRGVRRGEEKERREVRGGGEGRGGEKEGEGRSYSEREGEWKLGRREKGDERGVRSKKR